MNLPLRSAGRFFDRSRRGGIGFTPVRSSSARASDWPREDGTTARIVQLVVAERGRTVDEWKLLPGREKHLFVGWVRATVAASAAGITAVGAEPSPERQRKPVEIPKAGAPRKKISTKRGKW
jgi:hypothetical protein